MQDECGRDPLNVLAPGERARKFSEFQENSIGVRAVVATDPARQSRAHFLSFGLRGSGVAKELIWTGRFVAVDEALDLGLVTRIADDPATVSRGIAEIAEKSPHVIRAGKRLLTEAWNAPSAEALLLEEGLQRQLLGSPNQVAAVQAEMSGELPEFDDPAPDDVHR